jgi:hypothetical protein
MIFWITKKVEKSKILLKNSFPVLNAILPIIGVQNKARFNFKKAELGKTG